LLNQYKNGRTTSNPFLPQAEKKLLSLRQQTFEVPSASAATATQATGKAAAHKLEQPNLTHNNPVAAENLAQSTVNNGPKESRMLVKQFKSNASKPELRLYRIGAGHKVYELDPRTIHFSQSSVNEAKGIISSMAKYGWRGEPIDVIRLADGKLVTLDNTRVLAANLTETRIHAIIHEANDLLPNVLVDRFISKKGGVPATWSDALKNRIGKQSALYRELYPDGSYVIGYKGN